MKQILQSLRTGSVELAEVPCPAVGRGQLLIRSSRTLVSSGTERMLVDFGKAGWIDKARQQPDKVRMVIEKARTDGLLPTLAAVRNKLDQPIALGYCNVGTVIGVGAGVTEFRIGDRVASNGKHAEVVAVPAILCAKVPQNVSDEEAAFTVLGAIALQGIRLVGPTMGEGVVVIGLGLIGLMTVQLLRAHGCRVLGLDFDQAKLDLARQFGADVADLRNGADPVAAAQEFSRGRGVDAVIITAATQSNEPVHQAALMSRKRGRIVLVGVVGLDLSRSDFFEKELSFQVSCSYGPGRYDPSYEEKGNDYPVGFVRWTQQRNFEAVLDMVAERRISTDALVTHRFSIEQYAAAYAVVAGSEPSLGIVIDYSGNRDPRVVERTVNLESTKPGQGVGPVVSVLGAGNYAGAVLIPAFRSSGVRLRTLGSAGGVSSVHSGRKFGFEQATTDSESVVNDPDTNVLVISTRHDSHAALVLAAHAAGKHVFVEKPLCLTLHDLTRIEKAFSGQGSPLLMVGFNRRFAPQVQRIKALLEVSPGQKAFVMTVNAGMVPAGHWTQDPQIGGGRLVGEGCHFIDLLRFLADSKIVDCKVIHMCDTTSDSMSVSLTFADGSIGTVHYLSNGAKSFPKERLEVFSAGRVLQLDNFRRLVAYGWPGFNKMNLWRQDKGQSNCVAAFVEAVRAGHASPIPLDQLVEVTRVTFELSQRS